MDDFADVSLQFSEDVGPSLPPIPVRKLPPAWSKAFESSLATVVTRAVHTAAVGLLDQHVRGFVNSERQKAGLRTYEYDPPVRMRKRCDNWLVVLGIAEMSGALRAVA